MIESKEAVIKDLQDQIRDLRSFLKTRGKIQTTRSKGAQLVDVGVTPAGGQEGKSLTGTSTSLSSKSSSRKGRGRRRKSKLMRNANKHK